MIWERERERERALIGLNGFRSWEGNIEIEERLYMFSWNFHPTPWIFWNPSPTIPNWKPSQSLHDRPHHAKSLKLNALTYELTLFLVSWCRAESNPPHRQLPTQTRFLLLTTKQVFVLLWFSSFLICQSD